MMTISMIIVTCEHLAEPAQLIMLRVEIGHGSPLGRLFGCLRVLWSNFRGVFLLSQNVIQNVAILGQLTECLFINLNILVSTVIVPEVIQPATNTALAHTEIADTKILRLMKRHSVNCPRMATFWM